MLLVTLLACTNADSDVGLTANVDFRLANVSAPGDLRASDGDHDILLAPGVVIVHDATFVLFEVGQKVMVEGLESLAEDGNPAALQAALDGMAGVSDVQFIAALDSVTYEEGPIGPGVTGTLRLAVPAGHEVTFASMFGESNDTLVAGRAGVLVDENGSLTADDLSSTLGLYDMGTEVNQEPGVGSDQAPRQAAPNTGASEDVPVEGIGMGHDVGGMDALGFSYPAAASFAALTASIVAD